MRVDNSPRALKPGQVDIWFCATHDRRLDSHFKQYEDLLAPDEVQQYEQVASSEQGRDYLISRALLRTVLARYCDAEPRDVELGSNKYGKPQLNAPDAALKFNTAHSHGLTLCAVSLAEVGVDAEYHSDAGGMLDAADDYLSARELQALRRYPAEEQLAIFFRFWTLKEAYLKARGEGLSIPLHDFSILLEKSEFAAFEGPNPENWDFQVLAQNEQYTAAVALRSPIAELNYFQTVPLAMAESQDTADDCLPKHETRNSSRISG